MAWRILNPPRVFGLTKDLLRDFLELPGPPNDRPLATKRMKAYEGLIGNKGFRPVVDWATALCLTSDTKHRVNGQHTSQVLKGIDPLPDFCVVMQEYVCDSVLDVAYLFSTFDSARTVRTHHDVNMVTAGAIPQLSMVKSKVVEAIVSGMAYHKWAARTWYMSADDRAKLLVENTPFAVWADRVLTDRAPRGAVCRTQSRHLVRQPVIAAMLETWSVSAPDSELFWVSVRDHRSTDGGNDASRPERKLYEYLWTTSLNRNRCGGVKSAGAEEMYFRCVTAWNAWRRKEFTDLSWVLTESPELLKAV